AISVRHKWRHFVALSKQKPWLMSWMFCPNSWQRWSSSSNRFVGYCKTKRRVLGLRFGVWCLVVGGGWTCWGAALVELASYPNLRLNHSPYVGCISLRIHRLCSSCDNPPRKFLRWWIKVSFLLLLGA